MLYNACLSLKDAGVFICNKCDESSSPLRAEDHRLLRHNLVRILSAPDAESSDSSLSSTTNAEEQSSVSTNGVTALEKQMAALAEQVSTLSSQIAAMLQLHSTATSAAVEE